MANVKRSGLGKGIGALISIKEDENIEINNSIDRTVKEVSINEVEPSKEQPRQVFDKDKIEQLSISIKEHGIIQPLVVTKVDGTYRIIAGERRWRAARVAGLTKVPIIEREASTKEIIELALIENIQREDLNPIEEAEAYYKLISEYGLTQERISEIIGKSRPAIANTLRLLNFCQEIKEKISIGAISVGQAKPLLSIQSQEQQIEVMEEIISKGLNSRQAELLVKEILNKKNREEADKEEIQEVDVKSKKNEINYIQKRLSELLSTRVKLNDKNNKGKIIIEYYSEDERERLIEYFLTKEN